MRWGLSDGSLIDRRRVDDRRKRRLQRKMARQKLGSNSRRKTVALLGKHTHREQIQNRNALHREFSKVISKYDHIVIEDLDIKALTASAKGTAEEPGKDVKQKATMNRLMLSQNWGEFAQFLEYKVVGAGIEVVRVDPAYTSLACSNCGVVKANVFEAERHRVRFRCSSCGVELIASVNAARNILARGLAGSGLSAGERDIAGRANMEEITAESSAVRPENHPYIPGGDNEPG